MMITSAQRQALRGVRRVSAEIGRYEIAATSLAGDVLSVHFNDARVSIDSRGRFITQAYGPVRVFGLTVGRVARPVDLLT